MKCRIAKVLSANDTGETGGHQAGILVPKEPHLLSFFPELDPQQYNPRVHLHFLDDGGVFWEFAFIYYNNALFNGTRNEYRLTRMTKYIRQAGLIAGDELLLSREGDRYLVSHRKERKVEHSGAVLRLGSAWRIVPI
jgi:Restriction endonuclease EcoRII, N-terminal